MTNKPDLTVTRVRHPLKFRLLQVLRVQSLTPYQICITLTGDDLHDFESSSFDDHMKVFFPENATDKPALPSMGADGIVFPADQPRPIARDFTPRRFDREALELDIEFAVHDAGPATTWANQAQVGQYLGVGGPRGSLVIPTGFDWHLLLGDDTALPAIARRLAELPASTCAIAIIGVANSSARIELNTNANLTVIWRYRNESINGNVDSYPLLKAVQEITFPDGEGYVWAAGESAEIRAIRQHLVTERGIDKTRIRAASYWKKGVEAVHETMDD